MVTLVIAVGTVLGLAGGAMAFLITYSEYSRHRLGRSTALRMSIQMTAVVFAVFVVIAIIIALALSRMLGD